jgi:tRNA(Met) C34 N-acetyltransferase TmcA
MSLSSPASKDDQKAKQMCGCETCVSIISMQQSLNAWRHRFSQKLKHEASSSYLSHYQKLVLDARITNYTHNVFHNNKAWHEKPWDALKEVQSKKVDGFGLPHWKCVSVPSAR